MRSTPRRSRPSRASRWPAHICSWSRISPAAWASYGLPHLDAGPFLSYGIQWIAFGILAPIGLGYFVVSEIRQRRREKASQEAPLTGEEKLADRYGRRR